MHARVHRLVSWQRHGGLTIPLRWREGAAMAGPRGGGGAHLSHAHRQLLAQNFGGRLAFRGDEHPPTGGEIVADHLRGSTRQSEHTRRGGAQHFRGARGRAI